MAERTPSGYSPAVVADYIARAAMARGMDPSIALRVARSEGLNTYVGDAGSSFGPFQLHYGNVAGGGNKVGGLGDVFTRRTGLDARDPSTWQQQVDFSLDEAKRAGWSPWHGWKGEKWAGITGDHKNEPLYDAHQMQAFNQPLYGEGFVRAQPQMAPIESAPLAYAEGPQKPFFPPLKVQPTAAPQAKPLSFIDIVEGKEPPTQAPTPGVAGEVTAAPYSLRDVFEGKEPPAATAVTNAPVLPPMAQAPEAAWGPGRAFMRGAISGLTGGAGDLPRAAATVRAGYETLTGQAPEGFMSRRKAIIGEMERARQEYEAESPMQSALATGVGAGIGTLAPMGVATKAIGMGGRALGRAVPAIAPALEGAGAFMAGQGGLASKVVHGGAYGAGESALSQQLVPEEERGLGSIGTGALFGAGTAGVLSTALGPLAKSLTAPVPAARSALADIARNKFGIDLHVGQIARDEGVRKLYSDVVPTSKQTDQVKKWNEELSKKVGLGGQEFTGENVEKAMRRWGDSISNTVKGKTATADQAFNNELYRIHADILGRTPPGDPARDAMLKFYNEVTNAVGPAGVIKGEVIQNFIRHQGRIDRMFANTGDPLLRTVGHDLREAFIDAFERSNPSVTGFRKARQNYKALAAVDSIVRGKDVGVVNPKSLLSEVRKRKITGDVQELARIGQWLPEVGPTGAAKGGSKLFNKVHAAELAAAVAKPLSAMAGYPLPYGDLVSYLAAGALGRNVLQSQLMGSNLLNRAALSRTFPMQQALGGMGNVLTGTAAGLAGGVGSKEMER